ncbi:MAG: hypothetical protein D6679_10635 [Candidatus Hydrogenedentota bacterium]|nr:MAG: hypothetical protein D6679_10635 [Candidatus Hydrogenedentota bacterium]
MTVSKPRVKLRALVGERSLPSAPERGGGDEMEKRQKGVPIGRLVFLASVKETGYPCVVPVPSGESGSRAEALFY